MQGAGSPGSRRQQLWSVARRRVGVASSTLFHLSPALMGVGRSVPGEEGTRGRAGAGSAHDLVRLTWKGVAGQSFASGGKGIGTPSSSNTPIPPQALALAPTVQWESNRPASTFPPETLSLLNLIFFSLDSELLLPPTCQTFLGGLSLHGPQSIIPGLFPVVTATRTTGQVSLPPSWKRALGRGLTSRGGASG